MFIPIFVFLCSSPFTHAHWRHDFIPEILTFFNVRRCIMLLDLKDVGLGQRMRQLAKNNFYTVAMDDTDLTEYLFGDVFALYKEAVVGDFDSMEWSRVMSQSYHPAKIAKLTWIIFYSGNVTELDKMRIPYDCLFILASKEGDVTQLYELYHVKEKTFYKKFGVWSSQGGLNVSLLPFHKRRYNLAGSELKLLRMQEAICAHVVECAHVDLWYTMGRMMNFSTYAMTSTEAIEKPWLDPDATSQVTSFHANLLSQYDFLLDSIAPIWQYTVYIYVRHEKDESSPFSAYVRPFSIDIWVCLLGSLLLSSITLLLISWCRSVDRTTGAATAFKGMDCLCHQSGAEIGGGFSERVAILLTRLLSLTVVPSYSGAIISILTLQYPVYPFTDLQGFINDASFKLGAVNTTFLVGYFEYSENPVSRIITKYHFEDQATMPVSAMGGLKKVCKQKFAFLSTEDGLKGLVPPCRILRIPTPAFRTFAGMHLKPYSEFRSIFFFNLIMFQSTGIIQKLGANRHHIPPSVPELDKVAFEHVTPLLTVITIGTAISTIILTFEIILYRRRNTSFLTNIPIRARYDTYPMRNKKYLV